MGSYFTYVEGKFMEVKDLDTVCENLKEIFRAQKRANDTLREQNQELKDEHFKDEKIKEMQEQLDRMRADYNRGFPVSEAEMERVKAWQRKHDEECHGANYDEHKYRNGGAIGGSYRYTFCPTSIGTFGTCKCTCGATFDFQEA